MHIVIFGLALSSSWGNGHATTYRSLLKGLARGGHRVTFFERDVPWYAQQRDAERFDYCRLHLYADLDELATRHRSEVGRADAVIVGSYVPEGPRLIDWLERVVQGQLCYYDIDTPITLEKLARGDFEYLRADQLPRFDHYFSFAGGRALERLAELGARRPRPLYCSVDTELYRPTERDAAEATRWLLGYMGTYAGDRQPTVDALLIDVARRRPNDRFVIGGPNFPDAGTWPGNVEWIRHVAPAEHRRFYAGQAFTLNATRAAMVALGSSPSVRLFEAAACGCCIVSDAWPGLDEVLAPGREVLIATRTADVLGMLERIGPDERAEIGRAARRRIEAEHSHLRRAEELVACLGAGPFAETGARGADVSERSRVSP
ncbi:MAG TPA: glycosyltransferase [Pseudomonadales bacterium]